MGNGYNYLSPATRRELLRGVDVDNPQPHHDLLREVFDREREWREGPEVGESDEFENVYLAAFLLFLIGDASDALRLYEAKFRTSDMDLGVGMDAQAIFGAGRAPTLHWLLEHGHIAEHDQLSDWLARLEDPSIEEWSRAQRSYFYSGDGRLLLEPL